MIRRLLVLSAIAVAVVAGSSSGAQASVRPAARAVVHTVAHTAAPNLWCWDPYWGWYLCISL